MFSFLAVTPTLWLGMCLCKESVFESQGHSSRVCAGGGQKRPGRRAVALSQLLLFSPYRLSLMNSNETKPEVMSVRIDLDSLSPSPSVETLLPVSPKKQACVQGDDQCCSLSPGFFSRVVELIHCFTVLSSGPAWPWVGLAEGEGETGSA